MSSDDPLSANFDVHGREEPQKTTGHPILMAFVIVGALCFFCCGGVGVLMLVAVNSVTGEAEVALELRGDELPTAQFEFNQALKNPCVKPCGSPELVSTAKQMLEDYRNGTVAQFDFPMFLEAVAASKYGNGQIGRRHRLMVQASIAAAHPELNWTHDKDRILAVYEDPDGKLASMDVLLYSTDSLTDSYRFYFVKKEEGWKLYDWLLFEEGRRVSDEYASFMTGVSPQAEGFDTALNRAARGYETWQEGEAERGERLMRSAERIPMLKFDAPVAKLHFAYNWMAMNRYDEAARVLETIKRRDRLWGVWTSLGSCYINQGDYQRALHAAKEAAKISPDHPNVQWVFNRAYDGLANDAQAADAAIKLLRILPDDSSSISHVMNQERVEDVPELIDSIVACEEDYLWRNLAYQSYMSPEWLAAVVAEMKQRSDVPEGGVEVFEGRSSDEDEDVEKAAERFIAAREKAIPDGIMHGLAIEFLRDLRYENGQFQTLFDEVDDLDELLKDTFMEAIDDDFYGDIEKLADALQTHDKASKNFWGKGLIGWCAYENEEHAKAVDVWEDLKQELKRLPELLTEDEEWVSDSINYYMVESLLADKRFTDAASYFPDDEARHFQIGDFLVNQNDPQMSSLFVADTRANAARTLQAQKHRLLAQKHAREGDYAKADEMHRKAFSFCLGGEETEYRLRQLVRQRAAMAARNRFVQLDPPAFGFDSQHLDYRGQFLVAFIDEATRLHDPKMVEQGAAWVSLVEIDKEAKAECEENVAQFLASDGDLDGAIDSARSAEELSEREHYPHYSRQRQLARLLRRAGRIDEMLKVRSEMVEYKHQLSSEAIQAFLDHDAEAFAKATEEVDSSLIESAIDDFALLETDADVPSELLAVCPLVMGEIQPIETGDLVLSDAETFDESRLKAGLGKMWSDVAVSELNSMNDDWQCWVARSGDGDVLLFTYTSQQIDTQEIPEEQKSRFARPTSTLVIEVIDQKAKPAQRLFDTARAFATADSIAFEYDNEMGIWVGPDLPSKLAWKDRLPIYDTMPEFTLVFKADDETGVTDAENGDDSDNVEDANSFQSQSLDVWAELLEKEGKPIEVNWMIDGRMGTEVIPALLEEAEVGRYRATVRALEDSKLEPKIHANVRYQTYARNVGVKRKVQTDEPSATE